MPQIEEDYCDRCGEFSAGKRRIMIHRIIERFPNAPIAREFFCDRCVRIMRTYAIIGLTLLMIIAGAAIGTLIWLNTGGP